MIPKESHCLYTELLPIKPEHEASLMIGAYDHNSLEGILYAFCVSKDNWHIGHLYVVSESRRRGIGEGLVRKCKELLYERGATVLTTEYLCTLEPEDDPIHIFLTGSGFGVNKSEGIMYASLGELTGIIKGFLHNRHIGDTIPVYEMDNNMWEDLSYIFAHRQSGKRDGDVNPPLYPRGMYHETLSRFYPGDDGSLKGIILIRPFERSLAVDYLWCSHSTGVVMARLIYESVSEAAGIYPDDTLITWHAENPVVIRITKKMFSGRAELFGSLIHYALFF